MARTYTVLRVSNALVCHTHAMSTLNGVHLYYQHDVRNGYLYYMCDAATHVCMPSKTSLYRKYRRSEILVDGDYMEGRLRM